MPYAWVESSLKSYAVVCRTTRHRQGRVDQPHLQAMSAPQRTRTSPFVDETEGVTFATEVFEAGMEVQRKAIHWFWSFGWFKASSQCCR